MDGCAGYLIKTNLLTGRGGGRGGGGYFHSQKCWTQTECCLWSGSNQLPTLTNCSVWWGIFNIFRLKVNISTFLSDSKPFSVGKKKCLHIICWTSLEILSVPLRMLLLTLWDWSSCNMEFWIQKIFQDEFHKIFQQQKIVGSVLIRGGHLVNVAQLVSMKGEEGDGHSTPIPVCSAV